MAKKIPSVEQINNVVGIVKSAKQLRMRKAIEAGRALIIDRGTVNGKVLSGMCNENGVAWIDADDVYVVEV